MKYAVLLLGLLASAYICAQENNLKDFALQRSLKQDGLYFQFSILDPDKKGVHRYHPNKVYHWMKAQHVRATLGASSGELLHGTFEAFYLDKQLAQKGTYKKGLKNGTWRYWNQDGTYHKIETWHSGKLRGKQQYFDDSGALVRTEIIRRTTKKQVQPDSIIIWKTFDRKKVISKDSLGQTISIEKYKHDQLHGKSNYFENGKVSSTEKYKHGKLVETAEEPASIEGEESNTSEGAEKSGKLRTLWKQLFSKEKSDESTPKKKRKKERTKDAESDSNNEKE